MFDGLYSAASGIDGYTKNQEIIASNLANVNTAGYKKSFVDFKTVLESIDPANPEQKVKNIHSDVEIDFTSGSLEHTGSSLDIAIVGDGFFTIETADGQRYTKDGRFQLSVNGEIVTLDGGRLMGTGGPVYVPGNASDIKIDVRGIVSSGGTVIGELLISDFKRRDLLVPTGNSLFAAPLAAKIDIDVDSEIRQGYLEKSNVDVVMEMVHMIQNMRNYEAGNHIMKAFSDALEKLIRSQA